MNYCRQFKKYLKKHPNRAELVPHHIHHMGNSVKFVLPEGGCLVGEGAVDALDRVELVRIPFDRVTLEYSDADGSKNIILLEEAGEQVFASAAGLESGSTAWGAAPWFNIPKESFCQMGPSNYGNDVPAVMVQDALGDLIRASGAGELMHMRRVMEDRLARAARFIAALACKNIDSERVAGSREKFSKKSSALPYDSYHRLVLTGARRGTGGEPGGERRGPREHLRRGHIRHLATGDRVWVNSTVVNAGTAGTVHKTYDVRLGP